jgi:hypothetical protein
MLTETQHVFQKNRSTISICQSFIQNTGTGQAVSCSWYILWSHQSVWRHWSWHAHEKSDHYGMTWTINIWFNSHFTLQFRFVEITSKHNKYSMNNYNSTPRSIKYGWYQWSTLEPLSFSLHINNLPQHMTNAEVVLFTDDTNILVIHKNINIPHKK